MLRKQLYDQAALISLVAYNRGASPETQRNYFDGPIRKIVGIQLTDLPPHAIEAGSVLKEFLQKLVDDKETLGKLIGESSYKIDLEKFQDARHVIRWGFPHRNQSLEKVTEQCQFHLAHVTMGRSVLQDMIVPRFRNDLDALSTDISRVPDTITRADLNNYLSSFEQLLRVRGYAANFLDIWKEYETHLIEVYKILDPDASHSPVKRTRSDLRTGEILSAARTVLLSRHEGRHAPAPLIRSALESSILWRTLIPMKGSKFHNRKIKAKRNLSAGTIADAAQAKNLPLALDPESLSRIYDWASRIVHFGFSSPHQELWYAIYYTEHLARGLMLAETDAEAAGYYDVLLEELLNRGLIEMDG